MSKIALVTGAARGLGKATSRILLKRGASVSMVDIDEKEGNRTLKELQDSYGKDRVMFHTGNVTNLADMERVYKATRGKYGGLDIVINNAASAGESEELWERTVDVNVRGNMRSTMVAIENLRVDKGGRGGVIVNVADMAGFKPSPCTPAYTASKSALIAYSLCWAQNPELRANGVRINVFSPSFYDTRLADYKRKGHIIAPDQADRIMEKAGIMTSDQAAEALMELVEPDQNINGQVLRVNKNDGKSYVSI